MPNLSLFSGWTQQELCVLKKYPSMDQASIRAYLKKYPTFCSATTQDQANLARLTNTLSHAPSPNFAQGFQNISAQFSKPVQLPVVGNVPTWALIAAGVAVYWFFIKKRPASPVEVG